MERSIERVPFSLPRVQTFVATKSPPVGRTRPVASLSRIPSVAVRSPITSSAWPYMGDESITRPPSLTKSERTSSSCRRVSDVRSTSKVCHVPRPITGKPSMSILRRIPGGSLKMFFRFLLFRPKWRNLSSLSQESERYLDCARYDRKINAKMNSSTTRRYFIKLSAAAGGAFGLGIRSTRLFGETSVKPLRILILGGTGFTGPYQVRYALSRGHKVPTFNRGKTHPGELPNEVEQLVGDRNGQLDALKGRKWDVVIDNPTTLPAWVRDAAQVLKGNVERYVFISTISVYG